MKNIKNFVVVNTQSISKLLSEFLTLKIELRDQNFSSFTSRSISSKNADTLKEVNITVLGNGHFNKLLCGIEQEKQKNKMRNQIVALKEQPDCESDENRIIMLESPITLEKMFRFLTKTDISVSDRLWTTLHRNTFYNSEELVNCFNQVTSVSPFPIPYRCSYFRDIPMWKQQFDLCPKLSKEYYGPQHLLRIEEASVLEKPRIFELEKNMILQDAFPEKPPSDLPSCVLLETNKLNESTKKSRSSPTVMESIQFSFNLPDKSLQKSKVLLLSDRHFKKFDETFTKLLAKNKIRNVKPLFQMHSNRDKILEKLENAFFNQFMLMKNTDKKKNIIAINFKLIENLNDQNMRESEVQTNYVKKFDFSSNYKRICFDSLKAKLDADKSRRNKLGNIVIMNEQIFKTSTKTHMNNPVPVEDKKYLIYLNNPIYKELNKEAMLRIVNRKYSNYKINEKKIFVKIPSKMYRKRLKNKIKSESSIEIPLNNLIAAAAENRQQDYVKRSKISWEVFKDSQILETIKILNLSSPEKVGQVKMEYKRNKKGKTVPDKELSSDQIGKMNTMKHKKIAKKTDEIKKIKIQKQKADTTSTNKELLNDIITDRKYKIKGAQEIRKCKSAPEGPKSSRDFKTTELFNSQAKAGINEVKSNIFTEKECYAKGGQIEKPNVQRIFTKKELHNDKITARKKYRREGSPDNLKSKSVTTTPNRSRDIEGKKSSKLLRRAFVDHVSKKPPSATEKNATKGGLKKNQLVSAEGHKKKFVSNKLVKKPTSANENQNISNVWKNTSEKRTLSHSVGVGLLKEKKQINSKFDESKTKKCLGNKRKSSSRIKNQTLINSKTFKVRDLYFGNDYNFSLDRKKECEVESLYKSNITSSHSEFFDGTFDKPIKKAISKAKCSEKGLLQIKKDVNNLSDETSSKLRIADASKSTRSIAAGDQTTSEKANAVNIKESEVLPILPQKAIKAELGEGVGAAVETEENNSEKLSKKIANVAENTVNNSEVFIKFNEEKVTAKDFSQNLSSEESRTTHVEEKTLNNSKTIENEKILPIDDILAMKSTSKKVLNMKTSVCTIRKEEELEKIKRDVVYPQNTQMQQTESFSALKPVFKNVSNAPKGKVQSMGDGKNNFSVPYDIPVENFKIIKKVGTCQTTEISNNSFQHQTTRKEEKKIEPEKNTTNASVSVGTRDENIEHFRVKSPNENILTKSVSDNVLVVKAAEPFIRENIDSLAGLTKSFLLQLQKNMMGFIGLSSKCNLKTRNMFCKYQVAKKCKEAAILVKKSQENLFQTVPGSLMKMYRHAKLKKDRYSRTKFTNRQGLTSKTSSTLWHNSVDKCDQVPMKNSKIGIIRKDGRIRSNIESKVISKMQALSKSCRKEKCVIPKKPEKRIEEPLCKSTIMEEDSQSTQSILVLGNKSIGSMFADTVTTALVECGKLDKIMNKYDTKSVELMVDSRTDKEFKKIMEMAEDVKEKMKNANITIKDSKQINEFRMADGTLRKLSLQVNLSRNAVESVGNQWNCDISTVFVKKLDQENDKPASPLDCRIPGKKSSSSPSLMTDNQSAKEISQPVRDTKNKEEGTVDQVEVHHENSLGSFERKLQDVKCIAVEKEDDKSVSASNATETEEKIERKLEVPTILSENKIEVNENNNVEELNSRKMEKAAPSEIIQNIMETLENTPKKMDDELTIFKNHEEIKIPFKEDTWKGKIENLRISEVLRLGDNIDPKHLEGSTLPPPVGFEGSVKKVGPNEVPEISCRKLNENDNVETHDKKIVKVEFTLAESKDKCSNLDRRNRNSAHKYLSFLEKEHSRNDSLNIPEVFFTPLTSKTDLSKSYETAKQQSSIVMSEDNEKKYEDVDLSCKRNSGEEKRTTSQNNDIRSHCSVNDHPNSRICMEKRKIVQEVIEKCESLGDKVKKKIDQMNKMCDIPIPEVKIGQYFNPRRPNISNSDSKKKSFQEVFIDLERMGRCIWNKTSSKDEKAFDTISRNILELGGLGHSKRNFTTEETNKDLEILKEIHNELIQDELVYFKKSKDVKNIPEGKDNVSVFQCRQGVKRPAPSRKHKKSRYHEIVRKSEVNEFKNDEYEEHPKVIEENLGKIPEIKDNLLKNNIWENNNDIFKTVGDASKKSISPSTTPILSEKILKKLEPSISKTKTDSKDSKYLKVEVSDTGTNLEPQKIVPKREQLKDSEDGGNLVQVSSLDKEKSSTGAPEKYSHKILNKFALIDHDKDSSIFNIRRDLQFDVSQKTMLPTESFKPKITDDTKYTTPETLKEPSTSSLKKIDSELKAILLKNPKKLLKVASKIMDKSEYLNFLLDVQSSREIRRFWWSKISERMSMSSLNNVKSRGDVTKIEDTSFTPQNRLKDEPGNDKEVLNPVEKQNLKPDELKDASQKLDPAKKGSIHSKTSLELEKTKRKSGEHTASLEKKKQMLTKDNTQENRSRRNLSVHYGESESLPSQYSYTLLKYLDSLEPVLSAYGVRTEELVDNSRESKNQEKINVRFEKFEADVDRPKDCETPIISRRLQNKPQIDEEHCSLIPLERLSEVDTFFPERDASPETFKKLEKLILDEKLINLVPALGESGGHVEHKCDLIDTKSNTPKKTAIVLPGRQPMTVSLISDDLGTSSNSVKDTASNALDDLSEVLSNCSCPVSSLGSTKSETLRKSSQKFSAKRSHKGEMIKRNAFSSTNFNFSGEVQRRPSQIMKDTSKQNGGVGNQLRPLRKFENPLKKHRNMIIGQQTNLKKTPRNDTSPSSLIQNDTPQVRVIQTKSLSEMLKENPNLLKNIRDKQVVMSSSTTSRMGPEDSIRKFEYKFHDFRRKEDKFDKMKARHERQQKKDLLAKFKGIIQARKSATERSRTSMNCNESPHSQRKVFSKILGKINYFKNLEQSTDGRIGGESVNKVPARSPRCSNVGNNTRNLHTKKQRIDENKLLTWIQDHPVTPEKAKDSNSRENPKVIVVPWAAK